MPLASANWNSLARLALLSVCAATGATAAQSAVTQTVRKKRDLEPVKPAAALNFLLGSRRLGALGDFGIGIDRLSRVGRGRTAQDAVGEAAIGILDCGAL